MKARRRQPNEAFSESFLSTAPHSAGRMDHATSCQVATCPAIEVATAAVQHKGGSFGEGDELRPDGAQPALQRERTNL